MLLLPLTRWVLARAGRPIPRFGSAEWDALPDQDLRRVAAVLIAAECWRDQCSPGRVAADLREALLAEDHAVLARLRLASADVREGLRAAHGPGWWQAPSHTELVRRRAS